MTREKSIERWAQIAECVFTAEVNLAPNWHEMHKEAINKSAKEQMKFMREYCRAVAKVITDHTTDEELAEFD